MKTKLTQRNMQYVLRIGMFLILVIAIVQLFPKKDNFGYEFETGKPWTYELLTTPFDFPIYKSQKQLGEEREILLKNFFPYFTMDTLAAQTQINKLNSSIQTSNTHIKSFLSQELNTIYQTGIISVQNYNALIKEKKTKINCILPNRVSTTLLVETLYTPQTAYQRILDKAPWIREELKSYDLGLFLVENLTYDTITSEASEMELLKTLSLTSGMMQTGEKIIDKGEIVTPEIYQVLYSLKAETEKRDFSTSQSAFTITGEIMILMFLLLMLFLYLYLFRPEIFWNFKHILLILLVMLFIITITALTIRYTVFSYYVVPFALLPIVIRVFFDSRTALFTHIVTILIIAFITDKPFEFTLIQITAGMTAVSSLKDLIQRSQLAQTALYIFLCYICTFIGFELIATGSIQQIDWLTIIYFGLSSVILLFAYILIFFIEKIFGLISSVTLVELTNINSDLMMKFAEVAPGSFQHTLQVSNLATEAAKKINANSLLVRTGALYHDIGKMKHPEFFTENQMGGRNPLLELSFQDAAQIIISHVKDGIQLAHKNSLPDQIINFIATHHGTSKVKYFYNSFVNANPGVEVDGSPFTYPGPKPNTKETAILMMADAVEARSRSLKEYTPENIDFMVEDMIDSQIAEGQLKEAPISFRDVEIVKSVFKEKIKNIYHTRITYPELKKS